MPIFCYVTDGGVREEHQFPMGEAPETLDISGVPAYRDFRAEHSPRKARSESWPMAPCVGSGVNAAQAGELRKFLADRGVPTEVSSDGDPVYTSAGHRKKALKVRGLHDNASYC